MPMSAAMGDNLTVTTPLTVMFLVSFNVAFGRATVNDVVIALAKRPAASKEKTPTR